jgi:hypothetical protein
MGGFQSPCYLYRYNIDKKALEMLYKWDGIELVDIAMK